MEVILGWLGLFLLLLCCTAALVSVVFGVPGTLLILASGVVYAWAGSFEQVGFSTLGWLALLAVLAEGLEFVVGAGIGSARRPSRLVIVATVLGGLIGGLFGAAFFLGFGALPGAILGAFAGATLASGTQGAGFGDALRDGLNAARGRLFGFIIKIGVAITMTLLLMFEALR
jgi:uncharacterized protein YqgC (DUF456 family)